MTKMAQHPAASLPQSDRVEYLNVIASMALVDGRAAEPELMKLERLGEALALPTAIVAVELVSLKKGRIAGQVTREGMLRFRQKAAIRESLMMDSIVLAFSDGQLVPTESKQLTALATALGYAHEEVVALARMVEKILFKRGEVEDQFLARQFGETLAAALAPGGWLHRPGRV